MNKVLDLLKDPAWWFSAFFVAIIASLLASFMKDWLSSIPARFSSGFRRWNNLRIARNKQEIEILSDDFELLMLEYVKNLGQSLFFVLSALMFVLVPIWTLTAINTPIFDQVLFTFTRHLGTDKRLIIFSVLTIAFGLLSMMIGFSTVSKYQLIAEAQKQYRRKRIIRPEE